MLSYLSILIIINAILVGIIIMTQIISYPLFLKVPQSGFADYYNAYKNRITIVVIPFMVTELLLTLYIYLYSPNNIFFQISTFILILIWLSTFFIQVPIHNKISIKLEHKMIGKLISTNWIRTFLWILKLFFLCIYYNCL